MTRMPAISLAAIPGRRKLTLDLARRIEELGFSGIYCPSLGDALSLCQGIAMVTEHIPFGTSISPIYNRHVTEYAQTASFIHEISGGRFRFGIGVSHAPSHERLGIQVGKPLADIRRFVDELRAVPRAGELPPIVLATLRDKMIGLSAEISDGMVFANGSRSHMAHSLSLLPAEKRSSAVVSVAFGICNHLKQLLCGQGPAAHFVSRQEAAYERRRAAAKSSRERHSILTCQMQVGNTHTRLCEGHTQALVNEVSLVSWQDIHALARNFET